jgi:hypothetical protein
MDPMTSQVLVTMITVISTGAVTIGLQIYRERAAAKRLDRQRAWDLADRALVAHRTEDVADALAEKVNDHATLTAREHAALIKLLDANTQLTHEVKQDAAVAYSEANDVNLKLERLGLTVTARGAQRDAAIDALRQTCEETNRRVQALLVHGDDQQS